MLHERMPSSASLCGVSQNHELVSTYTTFTCCWDRPPLSRQHYLQHSRVKKITTGNRVREMVMEVYTRYRVVSMLLLMLMSVGLSDGAEFHCPEAILAFGDSLTDTGEIVQAFIGEEGFDASAQPPYGITYFGRPVDRDSDGRLVIDFLSQAFGLRLLDPYFENIAPDFREGINFATSTSRVRPLDLGAAPFYLGLQVNQAIRFHNRSLYAPSKALVPEPVSFSKLGLYFIWDGVNDISYALQANSTADRIRSVILPEIVSNVSLAITRLYNSTGARQFLIPGLTPFGCTSFSFGLGLPSLNPAYGPIDEAGCAQGINNFCKEYNELLLAEIRSLRTQLSQATIVYVDTFSIVYNVVANPSQNGFIEGIEACCGSGGPPYNFNVSLGECGNGAATVCSDPSKYVIWDGIHYTEALYKLVATTFLQGKFVDPAGFNFSSLCNLDFKKFNDTKES